MAAHWGRGWRGASWDRLWPRLRLWPRRARRRQAALEQVAWLPCQPEAWVNLGNSQAARRRRALRARPLGERARPRADGVVPRARPGARDTELGPRGRGGGAPPRGLGSLRPAPRAPAPTRLHPERHALAGSRTLPPQARA